VLVVPDTHCGFHDKKAWAAMLALASVWKPERVIIIGDFMDTESVSSHPASTSARTYLAEEYYAANVLLDELQAATPDATWLYLEGNHENRVQKWCAQYGELDGLFNVPRSLYIEGSEYHRDTPKLRGMTWVPLSRQPLVIDGVAYLHGHYENMHHAYHHALHEAPKLGVRCVVYGHMHGLQHAVAPHGAEAWCCGFLGDESSRVFKAYTKGRPRPWTLGVLLQEVGYGMVRNIPVRFVDGRALFDGRVIG
jgi:predicted phosphodiesterase